MAESLLKSEDVNRMVDDLILSGAAETGMEAEVTFLDSHLYEIAALATRLPEAELARHEAIKLLMFHGSRPWEDDLW